MSKTAEALKTPENLDPRQVEALLGRIPALRHELHKVIVGQDETLDHLLVTLLAGGHALLEGVPGLAKTLMVRTLAQALELGFRRIQFTPDLMPSDILGTEVLEEDHTTGRRFFRFQPGPIFANLVLADEINRSPPKTQAALLEAMQEAAVSYGGKTHALERPFFVLATQNPIEQAGTYPLPEAQLDRFLLYVRVGYPTAEDERRILATTTGAAPASVQPVLAASEVRELQALVRQVHVSDALLDYAGRLVRATRPATTAVAAVKEHVEWGAGPRAGQSLILAGKAAALLAGRFSVVLEDLHRLAAPVLRHRVLINFRGQAERVTTDALVTTLLEEVEAPKSPLG